MGLFPYLCKGMVSFLFSQPNKSLPFLNKNKNKNDSMSTKKKTVTKINYARLLPAMVKADIAHVRLQDALVTLWNKEGVNKLKPLEFRKGFIAFAISKKYDKRWAMEVAVAAGFRARAAGGGRKKTKPAKGSAEAAMAIVKAMPAKELQRFKKMLAAM